MSSAPRGDAVERTFAHLRETVGARRTWLRGIEKVPKRYLMHAAARNLGQVVRTQFKMGTPCGLCKTSPAPCGRGCASG
jgi:transposase